MKKKKPNPYDLLYLALCVILILTVCLHLSADKEERIFYETALLLRLDKSKGDLEKENAVLIDGKIKASVLFANDSYAVLLCRGRIKDGVFFADGAKTLCENQPLCFYSSECGGEGRVLRIIFTKTAKN